MRTLQFTLILGGIDELTPELANALYQAVDGDIECEQRTGEISVDIVRSGKSIQEAITGAVRDVEGVCPSTRVVRVKPQIV
jgi:hypothetical protein